MRWNFSPDFSLVSNRDSLVVNAAFLVFISVRLRNDYFKQIIKLASFYYVLFFTLYFCKISLSDAHS